MKITSIKQQVKQTNRYSVYVDEDYSFSLSESALLSSGIASGQELTQSDIDAYKKLSSEDKLFNRALQYVAMRSRSSWEVSNYLKRKEAPEQFIEQTIDRLTDLGLLNDEAFAISFARDRQLLRSSSKRKLTMELKQKHIADNHISAALATLEFSENETLNQLITKKRRQTKYQDDDKLMQYLARQGYGYSDIKSALTTSHDDF